MGTTTSARICASSTGHRRHHRAARRLPTSQALYAGLAKLEEDLMHHIHLENNVLFPRFPA